MGTPKEIITALLQQTAKTFEKKPEPDGKKNPEVIETERKAETARKFFSLPFIVEHTSADDIPELPTPRTSLSEKYQED